MFVQRFVTAAVLLCVFVGALLLLSRPLWAACLLPGLWMASVEWARLAGFARGPRRAFCAVTVLTALALLDATGMGWNLGLHATGLHSAPVYLCAALFWLLAVPLWLRVGWRTRQPWILALAGWMVLVPMWIALVEMQAKPAQLLLILGAVWVADTAAYLVGRRYGRRRLAPSISPGKTWEGAAAAAAAVAVYYAIAWVTGIVLDASWSLSSGAVVVATAGILSIEGDLFESWMKRQAGVKDSGSLLPGHGGLLDRIDGITSALPVAALLINVMSVRIPG